MLLIFKRQLMCAQTPRCQALAAYVAAAEPGPQSSCRIQQLDKRLTALSASAASFELCTPQESPLCCLQATWAFSMIVPAGQQVLFNTKQSAQSTLPNGLVQHTFVPTPPMSSYLVAFIVGGLANVTQTVPCMNGDVVVSVWGTPQR